MFYIILEVNSLNVYMHLNRYFFAYELGIMRKPKKLLNHQELVGPLHRRSGFTFDPNDIKVAILAF